MTRTLLVLALLLAAWPANAADINTGAAFLKIGTGARPAALGGAYTALADDVNGLYYNPAGLAVLRQREVGMTHAEWLLGSKFDTVGFINPSHFGAVGLGITRLDTGDQQGRDANRNRVSDFSAADTALTVSFSRNILGAPNGPSEGAPWDAYRFVGLDDEASADMGRRMGLSEYRPKSRSRPLQSLTSVGASVKFIQSKVGDNTASTVGLDLGAMYRPSSPLTFGVSALNLGRAMKFFDQSDPLPLTLAFGAAYRLGGLLQLSADIKEAPNDHALSFGFGTEYSVLPSFNLRAGFASAATNGASKSGGLSSLTGLGAGFGVRISSYRLDYTFMPYGELGNAQRFSLGARF